MKFSAVALLSIFGVAAAGRPSLTISVRDGNFAGLDAYDPSISWSGSSKSGDIDLEYGADVGASSTDIASLPKKIWGKASTEVSGWLASVRADMDAADMKSADLEIDAVNGDTSVKILASTGEGFSVSKVEATQGFDSGDARITVNPRYNMETEEADVVVGYDKGDTNVELTASADAQSVTVSQQVDDDNRIAPTLTSSGGISLEWERSLGDDNSLTATVTPDESLDLEWKDSEWTANINMPISGASIESATVNIKREVNF
jgi:hypothetical protein